MHWLVILQKPRVKETTYSGPKKTRMNSFRIFDDEANAHRWAKDQVEVGPVISAEVSRIGRK